MQRLRTFLSTNVLTRIFIYCYLRLLFFTYRLRIIDHADALPINKSEGLYYLWHEHAISALYFLHKQGAFGHLVSDKSVDGTLAGFLASRLGMRVMYSNGKPSFMRKALDVLEMNKRMYMVGDGADNPQQLQREIPYMCARTGVPLVFLEIQVSAALSFARRWDKLKLPLPFSKITVTIHKPRPFVFDEQNDAVEIGNAPE